MNGPVRVFVSAGEASGDIILGAVLERLRADLPGLESAGLGGPRAEAQGLRPLFPIEETAFSGAGDALFRAPFALRLWLAASRTLRSFRPDLALLVDYPGLNLRLARLARGLGVPVHFIAPPQAWAYRDPARKLGRARAALAGCSVQALYAFEAGDWRVPGIALRQGHFQDTAAPESPKDGAALLCPGSRLPVLRRNLPAWLRLLDASGIAPDTPFDVVIPPFLAEEAARLARKHAPARLAFATAAPARETLPLSRGPGLRIRTDAAEAMARAPRALAFPGTITLELALRRVPTLVLALLDPLTYAVGRRLLAGRRLALPNLILGEELFPEWAGTPPGPDPARFRALWESLSERGGPAADDRSGERGTWERKRAALEARLGPGDGARVAAEACRDLLRSRSVVPAASVSGVGTLGVL